MDFHFTPEEQAFREEIRAFLDKNLPDPVPQDDPAFIKTWNEKIREKRWIGFNWPREWGGGGADLIQQFILKEEMSARRAPDLGTDFMGLCWVGPAIIVYGSDEQKAEHLENILDGETLWCTGYSEPDVGSDLAALQCRAVRDGDEYVINGQKIWTTAAHEATHIFLLVRTDPDVAKWRGITCLLVPMDTPGIEIQPIENLSGKASFNQVFFNDVRTPVSNRLGAEGEGWRVVMQALANERSGISESTEMEQHLDDIRDLARRSVRNGRPALEDDGVRRRLSDMEIRVEAMRLTGLRHLTDQLKGKPSGSETAINKLQRGILEFEMSELTLELLGTAAQHQGPLQHAALSWHGTVIGGGSPNIQRNIIGERILGLPKD
ncbi:MAG: acyl-CoA dehydrogenase family protein [Deltaproteobacteria bacterium]|jgi:alkylation response protein AidB-like acyl-CoA dehydrogenase|nr:acyl-CoA dehydrogenase family protein [Deltaproteobacteria bacterium]